ncbi:NADPH2:quinone reductase [Pseudonocardia thermophila]|uniref:NADPH2:quinone reductase n=1 Tax=Pseudonocardia thermophila TaxID=1848 RepID=A0A1M6N990_PSETH|nr:quinone oxidoreductase [Pseudonocardia thermophila]SHJ92231.1 NADPH2:quinone reductase [Pseudonocardia thermophila]
MRAVQITEPGGPEVLTVSEVPDPVAGDGQVLVEVSAVGVNFIDTYHRAGIYPIEEPFVLGVEGVGRIVGTGERVAWAGPMGSYAERVTLPAERVVPVPDELSDELAAGALLQGLTAHALIVDTFPVQAGQDVLVHAAAGGLGLLLVQMAAQRGARVIGTVSTEEKAKLAREAGAAEIINYTEVSDVAGAVRDLTGGAGVHVVYDGVGASTFDASLASLRVRGMLVLCGAASGPVPPVDPQRLNAAGSVYLTRPKVFDYVLTREELLDRAGAVYGAVADGSLTVRIGGRYPLAEARRAHEDLEGRRTTGKLLLLP